MAQTPSSTPTKSATDIMQEILFSAVLDSIVAFKEASKGLPNALLRDLNAVHRNTTTADLPKEVQDAVGASVRAAFSRLQKEGYTVAPGSGGPGGPGGAPRSGPPRTPRPPQNRGAPVVETRRRPPTRPGGKPPARPR
ncbi:hypothetical protein [Sphingomonas aracearum]|uniref:hypothetical protein n=1 Tax=Sphingomonas aracearum TaxID=2283317 RepID=UPI0015F04C3A|nr:hypothetical protein [Sphingomonas aracearum]